MSEQWIPVEDGTHKSGSSWGGTIITEKKGRVLRIPAGALSLPDDIRLCRRVSDARQGTIDHLRAQLPSAEVVQAIREALSDACWNARNDSSRREALLQAEKWANQFEIEEVSA